MKEIKEGKYDQEIEPMKLNFKKAMKLAETIFADNAFRKQTDSDTQRNPLNKAYFEVISVGFAKLTEAEIQRLMEHKELFKENLISEMSHQKSYYNSFSGGTGKIESVRKRFSVFNDILSKSINGIKIRKDDK
jgi:hypothetical protein